MRSGSARFGLLVLALSSPAVAQNPTPVPTGTVPAPASPSTVTAPAPPATTNPAAAASSSAAPAWRPFQEFAFLLGSWSGGAESGARVGGRVARFAPELSGNYFVHRGSTILTGDDGKEETIEEIGYFTYDRDKRRYLAFYFFSTGVSGTFDVEIAPDGIRLSSRELMNAEAGTKARILVARKPDGELAVSTELAPAGRDFVPFLTSSLRKK
jgi:hypothetical protein